MVYETLLENMTLLRNIVIIMQYTKSISYQLFSDIIDYILLHVCICILIESLVNIIDTQIFVNHHRSCQSPSTESRLTHIYPTNTHRPQTIHITQQIQEKPL